MKLYPPLVLNRRSEIFEMMKFEEEYDQDT